MLVKFRKFHKNSGNPLLERRHKYCNLIESIPAELQDFIGTIAGMLNLILN